MLETVASQDLYFLYAFFNIVNSNNIINILNQSPLFNETLYGHASSVHFRRGKRVHYTPKHVSLSGGLREYTTRISIIFPMRYFWGNIYLSKQGKTKKVHGNTRINKDMELAFGILKTNWL